MSARHSSAHVLTLLIQFLVLARANNADDSSSRSFDVRHGRELVLAFTYSNISTINILVDLNLHESDWAGFQLPIVITRDVRIVSPADQYYLIDFNYISRKLRLANGVTLRLVDVAVTQNRLRVALSPGLDLLEPCAPGDRATLIHERGMLMPDVCYTHQLRLQNFQGLARSPAYPGTNKLVAVTSQEGCVNSTDVPRPRRCFPEIGLVVDVVVEATELSPLGGPPVPSNYVTIGVVRAKDDIDCRTAHCRSKRQQSSCMSMPHARSTHAAYLAASPNPTSQNMSIACLAIISEDCILQYTMTACLQLMLNTRVAAATAEARGQALPRDLGPPGSLPWGHQPPASASAAPAATNAAATSAPLWLLLTVGILGGTLVLLAAGIGAACFLRVRNSRQQQQALPGCLRRARWAWRWGGGVDGKDGLGPQQLAQGISVHESTMHAMVPRADGSNTISGEQDVAAHTRPDGFRLEEMVLSPLRPARLDLHVIELLGCSQHQQQRSEEATGAGGTGRAPEALDGAATAATPHADEELKLLPGALLGRGASGRVYRGLFRGQLVAVKMIGDLGLLSPAQKQFLQQQEETFQQPQQPAVGVAAGIGGTCGGANAEDCGTGDPANGRRLGAHVSTAAVLVPQVEDDGGGIGLPPAAGQHASPPLHWRLQQQQANQHPALSDTREGLVRALQQEVEILGRCAHPCIVKLLAVCVEPPLLVMELMDTSLERLQYGGGLEGGDWGGAGLLPLPLVLHIGIEVACGLAYMHPTLVHRDLKPANVLISNPQSERPVAKIADFGLSRLRSTAIFTMSPDAGTPAYMAPECYDLDNHIITHKVDVFALGVMMAEMLVGRRPWQGQSIMAIATATLMSGMRPYDLGRDVQQAAMNAAAAARGQQGQQAIPPRCPSKLLKLIEAMWDQDPKRRPAAAEVAKLLTVIRQQMERRQYG